MSQHHIIIGDGVTAAEFAITRQVNAYDTITVVGPHVNDLGRGIAYAKEEGDVPWRYAYLLNSPSISVDSDFSQWLPANWELLKERMSHRQPDWISAAQYYVEHKQIPSLNAPREIFGDFYHAKVCAELEKRRSQNITINLLPTRVVNIDSSGSKLKVVTQCGQQLVADTIDVATGGPQNQRFPGDNSEHSFPELFSNEATIADKLGAKGSIICIGAGAAMLDLLRFCQSIQVESAINFKAISPNGRVLKALIPGATFNPAQYELTGTFSSANDFLEAVISLQRQALEAGHNFYETRVGLRYLFMKKGLSEFIPNICEARKVARPLFNHFQGGTRDSIHDFNRLLKTGNTQIIAGSVLEVKHEQAQATVVYQDALGHLQEQHADVVVNCAGPGNENRFDVLTSEMLRQEWISLCPQSGGILVGDNAQTSVRGIRYLGPAVTSVGRSAQPVPFYDAYRLRKAVQQFNGCI